MCTRESERLMSSLVCGVLNEGLQPNQFRFDAAQANRNFQIPMPCQPEERRHYRLRSRRERDEVNSARASSALQPRSSSFVGHASPSHDHLRRAPTRAQIFPKRFADLGRKVGFRQDKRRIWKLTTAFRNHAPAPLGVNISSITSISPVSRWRWLYGGLIQMR